MDHSKRRRNVIKKLDFENCEVTTVRTRNGYRRRWKAKVTSEYKDEESQESSQISSQQQLTDVHEPSATCSSPILFRKGCSQGRVFETPSPELIRKPSSVLKLSADDKCQSETTDTTSPVFKIKLSSDKTKKARLSKLKKRKPSYEIDDHFSDEECVIEDFSQEADEECKISNFSSESKVESMFSISEDQSRETLSLNDETAIFTTPSKPETDSETQHIYDSGKKRKRNKKGGLVERLIYLRKQQASEKRIREHRINIMKIEENWRRNFHVVDAWKEGERLTLKCQQVDVSQDGGLTFSSTDFTYVILNKDIGRCFNKIQKGTSFRIAPPWQEVVLFALNANVLLGVNFVEIIDAVPESITYPPGIAIRQKRLKEVSVAEYKKDEPLLFDTMFESASPRSGYWFS